MVRLYRVRQLQKMLANGSSALDLTEHCIEEWDVSESVARKYVKDAYQGLAENFDGIDKRAIAFMLFTRLDKAFLVGRITKNASAMVSACHEMATHFYKVAPDETVAANMQAREQGTTGPDPEEEF